MSRYLYQKKALFLHIPRTGGTWIERALTELKIPASRWTKKGRWGVPRKHCLLFHYEPKLRQDIETVFTFVRHPVNYYESVWRHLSTLPTYRKYHLVRWDWHPHSLASYLWSSNFNAWVERMLECHPGWVSYLYDIYVGPQNGEFCSYIGRTRSLKDDLLFILSQLGYKDLDHEKLDKIPKMNQGSQIEISWNSDLKEQMLKLEDRTIKRFYLDPQKKVFLAPSHFAGRLQPVE